MSSEANGGLENFEGYYGSREMEKILRQLETGFVVTVISPKKKAENLSVRVIMETKELICIRVHGAKPELTINLSQVKDIRTGKKSADFDKCLEEGYKLDSKLCLVVLYGTAFNLKSLSFQAKDEKTFRILHEGLREVLREIDDNYYLEQKDRWVWKQFHTVMKADAYYAYCSGNTDDVRVAIKDIRGWFVRMNCKISSKQITQYCKKLKLRDKLSFNEFCFLFAEFLHPTKAIELRFMPYMSCSPKSKKDDDKRIGFEMIREFMEKEQKITLNPEDTRTLIVNFLNDQHRTVTDLHFTEKEFIDYLFSPENEIYDYSTMTDDMTQPLADYWIASSHNTYVTGNQVSSESSVEPYARCLRMGCRCVELDCHDGPDGRPIIYHGKTLTTKVKLVDVLHVIQENAFSSSEYPVILSIENHCSLMQQRLMAKMFHETFGESLLTEPIPNTEDRLPSPEQLKMKIIIKDKKLNEEDISKNADELRERRPSKIGRDDSSEEFGGEGEEKGTAQKSGILYLQDPATKKWQPYYCVLDDTNLILTPPKEDEEEEDDDDIYDFPYDDVYVGDEDDLNAQTWFHGSLGSKAAEALLSEHSSLKEGMFLVRENAHDGYSLSFWHNNEHKHCRIKMNEDKFFLNQSVMFDTIVEMIDFYQTSEIFLGQSNYLLLKDPLPVKPDFFNESWYHNTDRYGAENLLKRATEDGTFLIRPSSIDKCYSLSAIHNRTIRHFTISREGRLFTLGSFRFMHVKKLVDFFSKHSISKNMMLTVPATISLIDADNLTWDSYQDANIYEGIYSEVVERKGNTDGAVYSKCDSKGRILKGPQRVSVRALYDHVGADGELSFKRGAIITNVLEEDNPWWTGDHDSQIGLLFPANYVENVGKDQDTVQEMITIGLDRCVLEIAEGTQQRKHVFRLYSSASPEFHLFATEHQRDLVAWLHSLHTVIDLSHELSKKRQILEQKEGKSQELSKLIVYCQAVPFTSRSGKITEMSSFSEGNINTYNTKDKVGIIIGYNTKQLSRIYPAGTRLQSSNFDPIQMWKYGCQMVALNYQKPDRFQQLNNAFFLRNKRCGYVLKPECMKTDGYSPFDMKSFISVQPVTITVTVLCGRNIFGGQSTTTSNPYVSIEIIGLDLDTQKVRTAAISKSNSLCPVWEDQLFIFDITFPDLAFLRFEIYDESFEKQKTVHAQATYPLKGLREGYRCVPLFNHHSERHELSSLLVQIEIKNPMESEERNVFKMIETLRQCYVTSLGTKKKQLENTEAKLLTYIDDRMKQRRKESHVNRHR